MLELDSDKVQSATLEKFGAAQILRRLHLCSTAAVRVATLLDSAMAIELSKDQTADSLSSIQNYIREEWEQEIGELKARLLLDYILKEIAPFAYNKGVSDAEAYFRQKLEDLSGSCHEAELTYWTER